MSGFKRLNLPRRGVLLTLALCTLVFAPPSRAARAQDPAAKFDLSMRTKRESVMKALREQNFEAGGGQQLFDDYFNNYALLELFQAKSPPDKDHYPKVRKNLKNYFSGSKGGPPHARLNELTLEMMKAAITSADPKIDLSAKVNSMLIIGELNDVEGRPAKGSAAALDYLLDFIGQKRPVEPAAAQVHDALLVAAMIGVERLAGGVETAPLAEADQAKVRTAMLKLVAAPLPKGPARAGRDWIRGNAAEVLGSLKEIGPQGAVVTALDKGLADPDSRLRARCQMAEAIGQLRFPASAKIDYSSVAGHLGQLAYDVCAAQAAKGQKDKQNLSRRQLKAALKSVYHGLKGPVDKEVGGLIAAAATTPHKAAVEAVATQVVGLLKLCDNSDDDSLIAELETQLEQLQKLLATLVKDKTAVAKKDAGAVAAPAARPGTRPASTGATEAAVSR